MTFLPFNVMRRRTWRHLWKNSTKLTPPSNSQQSGPSTLVCHSKVNASLSTDTHQYLAADSCHPQHCKKANSFCQALWMRRICSSDDDFQKCCAELNTHLLRCGYEPSLLCPGADQVSLPHQERKCSHFTSKLQQESSTGGHIQHQCPQPCLTDQEPSPSMPCLEVGLSCYTICLVIIYY